MKKLVAAVFVVAVFFAVNAMAQLNLGGKIGDTKIPTSTSGLKDTAQKKGVETAINKVVDKYNNCAFDAKSTKTTCNLKNMGTELSVAAKTAGETTKYSYVLNVEAAGSPDKKAPTASERAAKVRSELNSTPINSWNLNVNSSDKKDNSLKFKVEVK